jgi:PAS domain S-box-containing protein
LDAREAFAFVQEVKDYAIYMIDPEGRVLTWNAGARAIKGYGAEEIVGKHFSCFFTEADRTEGRPQRLLLRAAAEGRVEDEGWRVRKDGTRFWANAVLTAVHGPEGHLQGFVKVTRDLTTQRHAEEKLRESEERMRLLVESVNDYAILLLDAAGRISTWNSGAERFTGYSADEVIGKHFSILYTPEAIASGHPEHELATAIEQDRYEEEGWRVGKGGKRFWASVVIRAIRDTHTGALRGFAKVTRDLTERRRMEEQAHLAAEQAVKEWLRAEEAQTALQQRDEFISVAAHELRTPLTALVLKLQGVSRALKKTEHDDDVVRPDITRRLDSAFRQTKRLTDLVERLLDVSLIVQGKLVLTLERTNFTDVVQHVVDDFREPALQAGSDLRFPPSGDIIGVWDIARIEQVVANLLSNAIKYGNASPIDVAATATDTGARLVVTDHGIGIAPEDVERIFSRFERAASSRHYSGLGLGLHITKSIVEAHSGTIAVSSELGHGTTFTLDLPIPPSSPTGQPGEGGDAAGAGASPRS